MVAGNRFDALRKVTEIVDAVGGSEERVDVVWRDAAATRDAAESDIGSPSNRVGSVFLRPR